MNSAESSSVFTDLRPLSLDDREQELEYGPGIVSRLKSWFLSISLQEKSSRSGGPLRRYSSMENLHHKDNSRLQVNGSSRLDKLYVARNRVYCSVPVYFSCIRKAKSMETLLFKPDQNCWSSDSTFRVNPKSRTSKRPGFGFPRSTLVNKDVVMNENDNVASVLTRESVEQETSAPGVTEDELPKPETVRKYKRLFESTDSKPASGTKVTKTLPALRPVASSTGYHSDKICHSQKTAIVQPIFRRQDGDKNVKDKNFDTDETKGKNYTSGGNYFHVRRDNNFKSKTVFSEQSGCPGNTTIATLSQSPSECVSTTSGGQKNVYKNCPLTGSARAAKAVPIVVSMSDVTKKVIQQISDEKPVANIKPTLKPCRSLRIQSSKENSPTSSNVPGKTDTAKTVPEELVESEQVGKSLCKSGESVRSSDNISSSLNHKSFPSESDAGRTLKPRTSLGNGKSAWKTSPTSTSVVFDFRATSVKSSVALTSETSEREPMSVAEKGIKHESSTNEPDESEVEIDDLGADGDLVHPPVVHFEGENVVVGRGSFLTNRNKKASLSLY
ncbi:uncharacterized protein LOC143247587 isoform X2 [Tachypleus tridentatus]|uniref:uncharacterized protein LOC143247587 isoform X2 n=1 Tax=Tachypleus tridentatus TaxID=6853 RepID=UPI003FD5750A